MAGLATAAEGLAQAFRSLATSNGHHDVMDLQPDVWVIETDSDRSAAEDATEPAPDEEHDADLGQPGPRHAR